MAASKKISSIEQYILSGKFRSDGFQRCRWSFCGNSRSTRKDKRFFFEVYLVNPAVSPNVPVISKKTRSSDSKNALSGGFDSRYSEQNVVVKPSYLLIKGGVFGEDGKQINKFIAPSSFVYTKINASIKTEDCEFSAESISGEITVTESELLSHPEFSCSAGSIKWNVQLDKASELHSLSSSSVFSWIPLGTRAAFSGFVTIDDEDFDVIPEKSFGYVDKFWGKSLPNPYFHISGSNLVSAISGKSLPSSFAIMGDFEKGELAGVITVANWQFFLKKGGPFAKSKITHDCISSPMADGSEKLHWSLSLSKGNFVVDLDIFCDACEMFMREYELPQGGNAILQILGGGNGTGEVRIFREHDKKLELLEHAKISDSLCEFGRIENLAD